MMSLSTEHASPAQAFAPRAVPALRRQCACGGTPGPTGECEQCRKKRLGLQRSAASAGPAVAPPIVHDVLRSPGRPLDAAVRVDLEPRFGHSFADVRVHTDARAAESAVAVGARAYTVGRDVVFAAGRYAPTWAEGRGLLAHELAHVVQQRDASAAVSARLEVGAADAPAEHHAEQAARSATASQTPSLSTHALGKADRACLRRTPAGAAPGDEPGVSEAEKERLDQMVKQYQVLVKAGVLTADEKSRAFLAIIKARLAIAEAERVAGAGSSMSSGSKWALAATAGLAADDITGIGIVDDVLIPFTAAASGLMAVGSWLFSSSPEQIQQTGGAAHEAWAYAIDVIGEVLSAHKADDNGSGIPKAITKPEATTKPLTRTLEDDECDAHYIACLHTELGSSVPWGHQPKHTRCHWCRQSCTHYGFWPSRVEGARCDYWNLPSTE